MYENRTIKPIEIVRIEGGGRKEKDGYIVSTNTNITMCSWHNYNMLIKYAKILKA
jgi:hypothetical protein